MTYLDAAESIITRRETRFFDTIHSIHTSAHVTYVSSRSYTEYSHEGSKTYFPDPTEFQLNFRVLLCFASLLRSPTLCRRSSTNWVSSRFVGRHSTCRCFVPPKKDVPTEPRRAASAPSDARAGHALGTRGLQIHLFRPRMLVDFRI